MLCTSLRAFCANATRADLALQWMYDTAVADQVAKECGKPLLFAFLASDWCPWSAKMEQEILRHEDFVSTLNSRVLLIWVDCPQDCVLPSGHIKRNQKLKEHFGIEELPTLVLVDPNGTVITKLGYIPLMPEDVARKILLAYEDYRQLTDAIEACTLERLHGEELQRLYKKATGLEYTFAQQKLIEAGIQSDMGAFFLLEKYKRAISVLSMRDPEVQQLKLAVLASDPANKKGTRYEVALAEFEFLAVKGKKKHVPHKVIAPLIEYLRTFGEKDALHAWKAEMVVAQFLFSKNLLQEALQHAHSSYNVAPEEAKAEIAQSLEYLTSKLEGLDFSTHSCDKGL